MQILTCSYLTKTRVKLINSECVIFKVGMGGGVLHNLFFFSLHAYKCLFLIYVSLISLRDPFHKISVKKALRENPWIHIRIHEYIFPVS